MITSFKEKQKTLVERKKRLRKHPTRAEKLFRSKLDSIGIRYMFQKGFIGGNGYYIADFYLPRPYKLVIEIDGSSHIGRKEYDDRKDSYLKKRRFNILRLENSIAEKISLREVKELIEKNRYYPFKEREESEIEIQKLMVQGDWYHPPI